MTILLDGTTGISTPAETVLGNLSYTGTLTGNGGIVNLGSGQVYKDASGNVGIGTSSPAVSLDVWGSSSVETINYTQRLADTKAYNANPGVGVMAFLKYNSSGGYAGVGGWSVNKENTTDGNYASYMVFATRPAGGSITERARIDSSGNLSIKRTTNPDANALSVQQTTSNSAVGIYCGPGTTGAINFYNSAGTYVNTITVSGSTITYPTSSDYRLKEAIAPMTGALAKVLALIPVTYKWKVDGSDGQGFIAHELANVCPQAVVGEKDAVREDGSIKPQGIDTSFLVATLTAAIQELKAIVDEQATRLTALEGTAA